MNPENRNNKGLLNNLGEQFLKEAERQLQAEGDKSNPRTTLIQAALVNGVIGALLANFAPAGIELLAAIGWVLMAFALIIALAMSSIAKS